MKYTVIFTQYHEYEVDAENENNAFNNAYNKFLADMHYPVANTCYDDVEITCEEEEE